MEQDWGDSTASKAGLATLQEVHSHKKDERRFQLHVILVFAGLAGVSELMQAVGTGIVAKDVILVFAPIFTFVLGKSESKNG